MEEALKTEKQEEQETEKNEKNENKKMPKPELEVIWFEQGDIISST